MKENKSPAEYVMDMLIRKYSCFQRIDESRQVRHRECLLTNFNHLSACYQVTKTAPKHSPQKYNRMNGTEYGQK